MRIILLSLLLISVSYSTTWMKDDVDDPVIIGQKCSVEEPASMGDYVYEFDSKYDQVFWPYIEENSIWVCEESGYISLMSNFSELKGDDLQKVKEKLKGKNRKYNSHLEKLNALVELDSIRTYSVHDKIHTLRAIAYQYESLKQFDIANKHRRVALQMIEIELNAKLDDYKVIEYLFVAAIYNAKFGNAIKRDVFIKKLNEVMSKITSEKMTGYVEYFKDLIPDIYKVKVEGVLAP